MKKLVALALIFSFGLTACDEEGPLERAGEEVDDAIEDIAD